MHTNSMGEKEAKMRAAKIYNAKHPDNPVTRKHKRSGKDIEKAIRKNKKRGY